MNVIESYFIEFLFLMSFDCYQYVTFILLIFIRTEKREGKKGREREKKNDEKTRTNRKEKSVVCFFLIVPHFFCSHRMRLAFDYANDEKFHQQHTQTLVEFFFSIFLIVSVSLWMSDSFFFA
jgi:hypothetical protein